MISSKYGIVTVNYFGSHQTKLMIDSLFAVGIDAPLVIVDNSVSDQELEKLNKIITNVQYSGDIQVLVSPGNGGYMAGLNMGVDYLKNSYGEYKFDWVVLCNNDLLFDLSFGDELDSIILDAEDDLGCISPNLVDSKNLNSLNPFLFDRPNKRIIKVLKLCYSNYLIFLLVESLRKLKKLFTPKQTSKGGNVDDINKIYATHGAIFILKVTLLSKHIDSGYFLYGEEVSVAERCLSKNLIIKYYSQLKVTHVSHSSTGSVYSYKSFARKKRSIHYVAKKYWFT
jgi:GT2 family glycosyltransferase